MENYNLIESEESRVKRDLSSSMDKNLNKEMRCDAVASDVTNYIMNKRHEDLQNHIENMSTDDLFTTLDTLHECKGSEVIVSREIMRTEALVMSHLDDRKSDDADRTSFEFSGSEMLF